MAYNYFPTTYQQPVYYPSQPAPQPPQPTATTSLTWVQGEAGAKSYLVAPNSTVTLWDSEQSVIYIKSADATGMPSIRTLDYTIRGEAKDAKVDYATKDELEALRKEVASLVGKEKK